MALAKSAFKTAPEYDPDKDKAGKHYRGDGTPEGIISKYLPRFTTMGRMAPVPVGATEPTTSVKMFETRDLHNNQTRCRANYSADNDGRFIYKAEIYSPCKNDNELAPSINTPTPMGADFGFFFTPAGVGDYVIHMQVIMSDNYHHNGGIIPWTGILNNTKQQPEGGYNVGISLNGWRAGKEEWIDMRLSKYVYKQTNAPEFELEVPVTLGNETYFFSAYHDFKMGRENPSVWPGYVDVTKINMWITRKGDDE